MHRVEAFRQGLSEAGYVEGHNVAIEFRWAQSEYGRLPELAADLVQRHVAVIAAPGSSQGPLAAKAVTTAIPIVFSTGIDPVRSGLAASLNHPGGNATGIISMTGQLGPKQLGLLQDLLPRAKRFAVLANPNNATTQLFISDLQSAAATIDGQIDGGGWHGDIVVVVVPHENLDAVIAARGDGADVRIRTYAVAHDLLCVQSGGITNLDLVVAQ